MLSVLRRLALLSLVSSALAVTAPLGPGVADAAAPTCQGKRATLVGTDYDVRGTAGPDVIVIGRSTQVYGGGGDDLICLTQLSGRMAVRAGDGNDSIVVTPRSTATVEATLGTGADTFRGGAGADVVRDIGVRSDTSVDSIATGPGRDFVYLGSADLLRDRVALGRGGGELASVTPAMAPSARLDGGAGSQLTLGGLTGAWTVDNAAGTASQGGEVKFRWKGFTYFSSVGESMTFRGSGAAERVFATRPVRAYLGGGDDRLELDHVTAGERFASGGPGTDTIQGSNVAVQRIDEEAPIGDLAVDVGAGTIDFGVPGPDARFTLFERHGAVSTMDAAVTGDAGADTIYGFGCDLRLDGGAGADRIDAVLVDGLGRFGVGDDLSLYQFCDPADPGPHTYVGGSSRDVITGTYYAETIDAGVGDDVVSAAGRDDTISGGAGDDELLGGAGDDTVDGGDGTDRCQGETLTGCER